MKGTIYRFLQKTGGNWRNYSSSSVAKWSLRIFDEAPKYCPLVATILFQDITLMEAFTLLPELFKSTIKNFSSSDISMGKDLILHNEKGWQFDNCGSSGIHGRLI